MACALEINLSILKKTFRTLAGHMPSLRIHVAHAKPMSKEILRIRESNFALNAQFCNFVRDTMHDYNWAPEIAQ